MNLFRKVAFWFLVAGLACLGATYVLLLAPAVPRAEPVAAGTLMLPPPPEPAATPPPASRAESGEPSAELLAQIPLPEPLVDVEARFQLPEVPSEAAFLESAPQLPADRVPRTVRLRQPLAVPLAVEGRTVGSVNLPTGTEVRVEKIEPGRLRVAHRSGSATVAYAQTDFSERVYRPHADGVRQERARIEAQRAAALRKNRELEAGRAARAAAIGPVPVPGADGAYAEIAAVLSAEGGPMIRANDVVAWGQPRFLADKGTDYWAVDVKYRHQTPLGMIQDQRVALWRAGAFERWVRGR